MATASSAEFIGAAQLWQEAAKGEVTQVKADKITVDSKTGNLTRSGFGDIDDGRAGRQPDDEGARDVEVDGAGAAR